MANQEPEFLWNDSSNPIARLQNFLEKGVKKPVFLQLNRNKKTLVSVQKERHMVHLSLHRTLLEAPLSVWEDLLRFIKGKKEATHLKNYLHNIAPPVTHVPQESLQTQGAVWNLDELYKEVETTHFSNPLSLSITWFGLVEKKKRSIQLGLFDYSSRLIKIHRLLDQTSVPKFIVLYVIFHEMLHAVVPVKIQENGRRAIHSAAFKAKERLYPDYDKANQWIKTHQKLFLGR